MSKEEAAMPKKAYKAKLKERKYPSIAYELAEEIQKRQIRKYVLRCRGTHKEEVLLARTIECLRQGSELLRQN